MNCKAVCPERYHWHTARTQSDSLTLLRHRGTVEHKIYEGTTDQGDASLYGRILIASNTVVAVASIGIRRKNSAIGSSSALVKHAVRLRALLWGERPTLV